MLKGLFCLAGAGVAAITLMACYGMPPCEKPAPDGGSDPYYCYDLDPCATPSEDGGTRAGCEAVDAGTRSDGGMTDAGR